jgi:predicted ATPase
VDLVSVVDESLGAHVIRTPDQRLRVFISSTLGELACERTAVREAVERLRLAPVMFELGARPHPPRALYRAYLAQSHIFIGIYWESYGWVAPGMAVSGIEDEYALSAGLPCLVYVKHPAPGRERRLEEFLARVQEEDRVSYKPFETAEQLAELVADDLALLLTEHFEAGAQALPGAATALRLRPLPVAPTRLVGRERDLEAICGLIGREEVRLLTLSGVGGIGKTRLGLAAAAALHGRFADGVGFADLSSVQSAELVPGAVAAAVGVPQEGTRPVAELLIERLAPTRTLLVLDNFEHVLGAAPFVSRLLAGCPGVKVLVTSRALLRLRGEHEFPIGPLELPRVHGPAAANGALGAAAVRLFVERAQEHQPRFTVKEANAEAVVELCRRLEGIPLAIELAAARVRVLPPRALLGRIEERLDLLTGPSDLPERQRTLRATIDWSYELLDQQQRDLFAGLSVFIGGFTLESAEAVCDGESDVLEGVSSLIEKSLVVAQERPDMEPRFRMLETVRAYAQERLEQSGRVLGMLALVEGDQEMAERLGQEALGHARAIGSESAIGVALGGLGYTALAGGDVGRARARFADSAMAHQRVQDREGLTYALEGLAAVAFGQGKPELAARAIGAVDGTREQIGVSVYPLVQRIFRGPFVSAVRATLGPDRFEAARAAGAETDLDEALEELLSLTA